MCGTRIDGATAPPARPVRAAPGGISTSAAAARSPSTRSIAPPASGPVWARPSAARTTRRVAAWLRIPAQGRTSSVSARGPVQTERTAAPWWPSARSATARGTAPPPTRTGVRWASPTGISALRTTSAPPRTVIRTWPGTSGVMRRRPPASRMPPARRPPPVRGSASAGRNTAPATTPHGPSRSPAPGVRAAPSGSAWTTTRTVSSRAGQAARPPV